MGRQSQQQNVSPDLDSVCQFRDRQSNEDESQRYRSVVVSGNKHVEVGYNQTNVSKSKQRMSRRQGPLVAPSGACDNIEAALDSSSRTELAREEDSLRILQEYQTLTKNGSKKGDKNACQDHFEKVFTERCLKGPTHTVNASQRVAALWGKKQQPLGSNIAFVIPQSSVNGYRDIQNALRKNQKDSRDQALAYKTHPVSFQQSPMQVASPKILGKNINMPILKRSHAEQVGNRNFGQLKTEEDRIKVMSRQTNERPNKMKEQHRKQNQQQIKASQVYTQKNFTAKAQSSFQSQSPQTHNLNKICGIQKIKQICSKQKMHDQDPWQLHRTLKTKSMLGQYEADTVHPNISLQSALNQSDNSFIPQIDLNTSLDSNPDVKVRDQAEIKHDDSQIRLAQEYAIYCGLESQNDSEETKVDSYLTQHLMSTQLNNKQLRNQNGLDNQSTESIDSDRFRSISQIFKDKRATEMVGKKINKGSGIRANVYRRSMIPKIECGAQRNFTITAFNQNHGSKVSKENSPKLQTDIGTIKYIYNDKSLKYAPRQSVAIQREVRSPMKIHRAFASHKRTLDQPVLMNRRSFNSIDYPVLRPESQKSSYSSLPGLHTGVESGSKPQHQLVGQKTSVTPSQGATIIRHSKQSPNKLKQVLKGIDGSPDLQQNSFVNGRNFQNIDLANDLPDYFQSTGQPLERPQLPIQVTAGGRRTKQRRHNPVLDSLRTKQSTLSPVQINGSTLFKLPHRQSKSNFGTNYSHVLNSQGKSGSKQGVHLNPSSPASKPGKPFKRSNPSRNKNNNYGGIVNNLIQINISNVRKFDGQFNINLTEVMNSLSRSQERGQAGHDLQGGFNQTFS